MTRIFTFLTVLLTLSLIVTPHAQAQEFSDKQTAEINKLIEAYLIENGETVIKSVEAYQNKQDEEARKNSEIKAKEFLTDLNKKDSFPMAGNPKGDVTIVEFFDYNCGYCTRALEELVTVIDKDKNLKVIFFDMPILGPNSLEASKWSMAAHKQGKYFEFHQKVMKHQGQKDEKVMEKIAKDIGLDLDKLMKDKDSKEVADLLQNNVQQAQAMNIRGTPGFIIDGQIFPGYMPADRILEIIEEARLAK